MLLKSKYVVTQGSPMTTQTWSDTQRYTMNIKIWRYPHNLGTIKIKVTQLHTLCQLKTDYIQ